jgi:transcriptional regulator with XRE-family HTH domain
VSTTESSLATSKLASSKEYRDAFVSAFLKRYIPFQIRTIRKNRDISQQQLAKASKVTQGVISRAEDSDYGNLTLNTVLRIAAGYDLAFIGKFVRFSEFLKVAENMSEQEFDLPSFLEECEQEAKATVANAPATRYSLTGLSNPSPESFSRVLEAAQSSLRAYLDANYFRGGNLQGLAQPPPAFSPAPAPPIEQTETQIVMPEPPIPQRKIDYKTADDEQEWRLSITNNVPYNVPYKIAEKKAA